MKKYWRIKALKLLSQAVLIMLTLIVLSACSSKPGNSELETLVKPTLTNPLFDVVSIRKVDGNVSPEGKALGVEAYDLKYEYEVKFKNSLSDRENQLKAAKTEAMAAYTKRRQAGGLDATFALLSNPKDNTFFLIEESQIKELKEKYGDYKAGEIKKLTGTASFLKTEKGWKL